MDYKQKQITVLSIFSRDTIINEEGKIINNQKGGPAFYISDVFKKEKIFFDLIRAPFVKVEISILKNREEGKLKKLSLKQRINFKNIKTPYLLISTVASEFDLNCLGDFKGKVFLDIQGYVRDAKVWGKKKQWRPAKKVVSSIFCLKGTDEEIKYLPAALVRQQRKKILIITKGASGCEIYAFNKRYNAKIGEPIEAPNTIGAGDHFFASLVSKFLKTNNILMSSRYAINSTCRFLSKKKDYR